MDSDSAESLIENHFLNSGCMLKDISLSTNSKVKAEFAE